MSHQSFGGGSSPPLPTHHYLARQRERDIPTFVLDALHRDSLSVRGFSPKDGRLATLRLVRVTEGFWVFPSRSRRIISVYFVENHRTEKFFRTRLLNVEELSRLHRLPVTKSFEEQVTDELRAHYAEHGVLNA